MADEPILKVTRESLSSGIIRKMAVERNDGDVQIASDEELYVSRRSLSRTMLTAKTSGSLVTEA